MVGLTPASVKDLLRARLQAVSEPTRQMLTAAAVLGSDNDADLLRAVSGRGEDEIVEAIDEAQRPRPTCAAAWPRRASCPKVLARGATPGGRLPGGDPPRPPA